MMIHGDNALVIGASMSGLLAARALSEFYTAVTILERDDLLEETAPRRGVPQGRHAHGLLASGARALERAFPGFRDEVAAAGGAPHDIARDCLWHNFGGFLHSVASDMEALAVSRPTLERVLRRRVRDLPNVKLLSGQDVVRLEYSRGRVAGVHARGPGGVTRRYDANLVLDASGRGGRTLDWLDALGFPKPSEERVQVDITYTTRQFRRSPQQLAGRHAVVFAANPANWRPAAMLSQDGGRWLVTLAGYLGDCAPSDLAGFLAYAKTLPSREIYDAIVDAEPIGEAATYHFKASQRRRYEKLDRFPEGFLVFGDAIASFNPIYGQGMATAAAEAEALRDCLSTGPADLARRFFRRASHIVDAPWSIATGADLAHPGVQGDRTAAIRLINGYVARVFRAGHADPEVARAFLEVANLLAPPTALFRPSLVWRVLRARGGSAATDAPAASFST